MDACVVLIIPRSEKWMLDAFHQIPKRKYDNNENVVMQKFFKNEENLKRQKKNERKIFIKKKNNRVFDILKRRRRKSVCPMFRLHSSRYYTKRKKMLNIKSFHSRRFDEYKTASTKQINERAQLCRFSMFSLFRRLTPEYIRIYFVY